MKLADMTTSTKDVVIETVDFKPVKLESSTRVLNGKQKYESNVISTFKGRNVELNYGGKKFNYTINRDFITDGGYFLDQLIKAKLKAGFEVTNYVYNPSVELETPIKATTKVAGYENILIKRNRKETLSYCSIN